MERFDIAILGTGPAGLEASIVSKLRNKKILLIGDKNLSDKITRTQEISNFLGFEKITGADLADKFKKHLNSLAIDITEDKIQNIYNMGKYYSLQGKKNNYEATSVILAIGVNNSPQIKGEEQFLGQGVSYCATCDAPLYKNKIISVIGYEKEEEQEVIFLSQVARKILYFPMYKLETVFPNNVEIINDKPLEIRKNENMLHVLTDQNDYETNGIFVLRDVVNANILMPELKMNGPHVIVDREMRTNLLGIFACGDLVGQPYQYIKSAGEGNIAALSAVKYLDHKM